MLLAEETDDSGPSDDSFASDEVSEEKKRPMKPPLIITIQLKMEFPLMKTRYPQYYYMYW